MVLRNVGEGMGYKLGTNSRVHRSAKARWILVNSFMTVDREKFSGSVRFPLTLPKEGISEKSEGEEKKRGRLSARGGESCLGVARFPGREHAAVLK